MNDETLTLKHRALALERPAAPSGGGGWLHHFAQRALRAQLRRLEHGVVTLVDGARRERFGKLGEDHALECTVHVHDPRFYPEVAFGGSVGAGESFMAGDWTCDDLTALMRILLANRELLDGLDGARFARARGAVLRLLHAAARNTRAGSRRNIGAHYDIGNDFFELFLDPSMMYSCAYYERDGMTLGEAQFAKLERICRKLELAPGDHLLEIGTGWGALAIHAASRYGCRVTTTTISREQYALARERVADAGLADRVTVLFEDYRELRGTYGKLVSVEMIEAIGHQYFDLFFARCGELLAPGGTMLLQAITIADQRFEAARDSVDFIKRHIFPGCCIPSVGAMAASVARTPALRIVDLEDIGPHYATTLAAWSRNLEARKDEARSRGYPEALLRMWDFYLAYCEGGFAERALGDVQMMLQDTRRSVAPRRRA